jgi:hypothetical protein
LLVLTRGTISDEEFSAIKAAGYTDEQLVDISLALAVIAFTNVFNRTNDTALDRGRLGRLSCARPRLARGRTCRSLNEGMEPRICSSKSWRGPVSSERTSTMTSCAPR